MQCILHISMDHKKALIKIKTSTLNGLNLGFSINLNVRSSRLEQIFIISDVSSTYTAAIIIIYMSLIMAAVSVTETYEIIKSFF